MRELRKLMDRGSSFTPGEPSPQELGTQITVPSDDNTQDDDDDDDDDGGFGKELTPGSSRSSPRPKDEGDEAQTGTDDKPEDTTTEKEDKEEETEEPKKDEGEEGDPDKEPEKPDGDEGDGDATKPEDDEQKGDEPKDEDEQLARLRKQDEERQKRIKDNKKKEQQKDAKDEITRRKHREQAEKDEEERFREAQERARAAATIKPYTKKDREKWAMRDPKAQESLADKMKKGKRTYSYNPGGGRGPSQIVTYKSQFIEKLSDITDDMNISGALSIKYGAIGGSGRGAFVDSDKFKESDLNFYVSVKVVNQTVNLKDALIYQPIKSVNGSNFNKVFGDTFISGFIEGGEFNAVVSMKVLNKDKMTKIKAQAKIALTVGAAEIGAEAAVNIAKQNINNHTETTIMVSWSGGGFIKPIDEPWNIESLMDAAARFPDLVARTPQRTYAILTKYDVLRSFVKLKPKAFSKMQYENAQIYTNMLMETYMEYKAVIKNITSLIFDIQNGIRKFPEIKKGDEGSGSDEDDPPRQVTHSKKFDRVKAVYDRTPFEASVVGLDDARRAARFQMVLLVNEVDAVTEDPTLATEIGREEPAQTPIVFRSRLPKTELNVVEEDPFAGAAKGEIPIGTKYPPLCQQLDDVSDEERLQITNIVARQTDIAGYFRLSPPVGSKTEAEAFNDLDFLKYNFLISSIKVRVDKGVVVAMQTKYTNGLMVAHGDISSNSGKEYTLSNLGKKEKIIACSIEAGEPIQSQGGTTSESSSGLPSTMEPSKDLQRITSIKLYTNRGRTLQGQADNWRESGRDGKGKRDDTNFSKLTLKHYDQQLDKGFIKGFWGRTDDSAATDGTPGIWRLGPVWGSELEPPKPEAAKNKETEKK
ncbi:hypothetical protein TWF694_000258 [Orbilia ellipsospora]|uniref:Jacalin-type lectin domain-containing protein n=1 Tax=Orbilia ellipsospora TaxID=2528407 RepID=A0AAV9XN25_9PEZI